MESARLAGGEDLARLGELAHQAVQELRARRGGGQLLAVWAGRGREELVEGLTRTARREDARVWAGLIDQEVVGVASARGQPGTTGVIELLYVEPEARGVGVGEALLDGVASWLGERGCTGIDAPALPGDRDTKQFFEGSGMVARLLIMHRPL